MIDLYDEIVSYGLYTILARKSHWACMDGVKNHLFCIKQKYGKWEEDILNYVVVSPLFFASSASRFRARYLSLALIISPSVF